MAGWSESLYRAWYMIGAFFVAAYLGSGSIYLPWEGKTRSDARQPDFCRLTPLGERDASRRTIVSATRDHDPDMIDEVLKGERVRRADVKKFSTSIPPAGGPPAN